MIEPIPKILTGSVFGFGNEPFEFLTHLDSVKLETNGYLPGKEAEDKVSLTKKSHGKLATSFFYKYYKAIGFFSSGYLKRETATFFFYLYWLRIAPYKQCFKIFKCMPIYFKL